MQSHKRLNKESILIPREIPFGLYNYVRESLCEKDAHKSAQLPLLKRVCVYFWCTQRYVQSKSISNANKVCEIRCFTKFIDMKLIFDMQSMGLFLISNTIGCAFYFTTSAHLTVYYTYGSGMWKCIGSTAQKWDISIKDDWIRSHFIIIFKTILDCGWWPLMMPINISFFFFFSAVQTAMCANFTAQVTDNKEDLQQQMTMSLTFLTLTWLRTEFTDKATVLHKYRLNWIELMNKGIKKNVKHKCNMTRLKG